MPTRLPDARISPRFAGISTFGRYPMLKDVPPQDGAIDWAIYGAPFDGGVTFRPGARFGPRAIREASQYLKRFHLVHEVDICEKLSLADAGDSPVSPFDCGETASMIHDFAVSLGAKQTKTFALGGDHSIAYGNIKAAWHKADCPAGGLSLVHFDSHLDTVDQLWGEKHSHASPFIRAIEDGYIDPSSMISIGIKGPLNSKVDLDYAKSNGIRILPHHRIRDHAATVIPDFVKSVLGRPTYLSFDIDVIDPAFAPGTGTPCPGGLTTDDAFGLLRAFKGINLAGADVVEVLPDRDSAGITSFAAAHIVFEILALDACAR